MPDLDVILVGPLPATLSKVLRDEAFTAKPATLAILQQRPQTAVYVFGFERPLAHDVVERIASWASRTDERPGLVGVLERGTTADREALLAARFDDAVTGPLSQRELVARVRAVSRRTQRTNRPTARFGSLEVDTDQHAAAVDGKRVLLTPVELAVLRALVAAAGRVCTRGDLLETLDDSDSGERAIDNVIVRLRRKLRADLIESVRGVGYRLAR